MTIKQKKQSTSNVPISLLLLIASIFVFSAACGKRGAPIPPKERVNQIAKLDGYQRGDNIVLSWKMPVRNASKNETINISRADIYRLAEPANAPLKMTEEEFANQSTLIAALKITKDDFAGQTLMHRDKLQIAGQAVRLRYAIRFVNASGQKAGFSNALMIEPASKVSGSPSGLAAVVSQDAIKLEWSAPAENIDGTTPASIIGYNIYRSSSEKAPAKLLNQAPVTATTFDDEFFEFDKDHYYFVRAVSVGVRSEPIESSESNILSLKPVDTFAPSAPSAITVAASPTTISIFFAVNPEKDIDGYKIYRSTDDSTDKVNWELLTPELLKTNTFQDTKVESGKTYFYYITATDKFKNVSDPSEIVSEIVP